MSNHSGKRPRAALAFLPALKDGVSREVSDEKGGINYWDYSQKPKGIYFASHCYSRSGGITSWQVGQKGDGYIPVVALERYSAKQLRLVRERVEAGAAQIHDVMDGKAGSLASLKAYLRGEIASPLEVIQTEEAA